MARTRTDKENSPLSGTTKLKEKDNSLTAITRFVYFDDWYSVPQYDLSSISDFAKQEFFSLKTENNQTEIDTYNQQITIIQKETSQLTGSSFYFEVIVEYDTEALEYLYNLNLGSDVLDGISEDKAIEFTQDWYFEIK